MEVTNIIKGHVNELMGNNQELSEERFKICRNCKLYHKAIYGEICNDDLYLNPITNDVSKYPLDEYFQGCGCRLKAKTTLESATCPANKW